MLSGFGADIAGTFMGPPDAGIEFGMPIIGAAAYDASPFAQP
jgi:hypothetical protein